MVGGIGATANIDGAAMRGAHVRDHQGEAHHSHQAVTSEEKLSSGAVIRDVARRQAYIHDRRSRRG